MISICFNNVEMTANMYSELREEARDHARLRNAYFEQVCPDSELNYLIAIKKCSIFDSLLLLDEKSTFMLGCANVAFVGHKALLLI